MSKRDDHLRKAETLLGGVDDGIQKFAEVYGDVSAKEIVAMSTWFNALTNAARAHTALAEYYAQWGNDDDA